MPPRSSAAHNTMPLFGFLACQKIEKATKEAEERVPSPGVDSDEVIEETESPTEEEAATETVDHKAQPEAALELQAEEHSTEEAKKVEETKKVEEAKKAAERDFMNMAFEPRGDDEYDGGIDSDEAVAIAEVMEEAARADTTTHCYLGAKRTRDDEATKLQTAEETTKLKAADQAKLQAVRRPS